MRVEEEENEAKNKNIEENLEQIKEKLFDIEGVGVLTKSEVDERVNMILKMYGKTDDEADADYESVGVKIEPEETWKDREGNEKEDVSPDWMDEELYLYSQIRSGKKFTCHSNDWPRSCFIPIGWSWNQKIGPVTKPDVNLKSKRLKHEEKRKQSI